MNSRYAIMIMSGLCLMAIFLVFVQNRKATISAEMVGSVSMSALVEATQPRESELVNESASEWLEDYESNGPQGTRGTPMHPMSLRQCILVLIVLASSGILVLTVKAGSNSSKQWTRTGSSS